MAVEATDAAFESLLGYIRENRGFDFTGSKRPSLRRRFEKRMQTLRIATFAEYQEHVVEHPEEFDDRFDTILINVTSFFRDRPAWDFVRSDVIPRMLEARSGRDIRVWSTGCSTGEEAYTLAMVLAEALGEEQFRSRVKIYATDVDGDALSSARHAIYSAEAVESVPDDLRTRYFERLDGSRYVFRPDLRRTVIFGRHDLGQDPRSRGSTCSRPGTRSCTSRPRRSGGSCRASTSRCARPGSSSSASPRC
jgi:two-component system CheB/CheR fusion protein